MDQSDDKDDVESFLEDVEKKASEEVAAFEHRILDGLQSSMDALKNDLHTRIDSLESEISTRFGELEKRLKQYEEKEGRWVPNRFAWVLISALALIGALEVYDLVIGLLGN